MENDYQDILRYTSLAIDAQSGTATWRPASQDRDGEDITQVLAGALGTLSDEGIEPALELQGTMTSVESIHTYIPIDWTDQSTSQGYASSWGVSTDVNKMSILEEKGAVEDTSPN